MQTLFAPAIALMNRLRYAGKFVVIGFGALLVMAGLLFSVLSGLNRSINSTEHELLGLKILGQVNRMVEVMQQHRGLSSGVLNGNEAMKEKRTAKETDVVEALAAADKMLPQTLRDEANWKKMREDWEAIRGSGLSWSAADNIRRHSEMIDRALLFMISVADQTELTFDSSAATYYMMDTIVSKMPGMLEPIGITRARGTGVLSKKELLPPMRVNLVSSMAQMESILRAQNINLEKVGQFAPDLKNVLSSSGNEFTENTAKLFALIREDILGERFATAPADYFAMTTALLDRGYKIMYEVLIPQFEKQLKDRVAADRSNLYVYAALAIGVVFLVVYLGVGVYFSVTNSVAIFQTGARRMASGDLTARFSTTGADELHEAGNDFNNMAESLRNLLSRVQSDVQQLNLAADALALNSEKIAQGVEAQSVSASDMAAAVEEMTVGVDHITQNALDAQLSSDESDALASRGGTIVQGVMKEIEEIAGTVNDSAGSVEQLGQQSDRISAIVGAIKDIAGQTNLLALNAAIEAARAGESGRGFAVVADEVRKLAERTARSTQEITEMIGAVQAGTAAAVDSMKRGVDRVASGVEQAGLAGDAIAQIQSQSRQVRESIASISGSLREQSAASLELAKNVEQIAQKAEANSASVHANLETVKQLRQLSESLNIELANFKT